MATIRLRRGTAASWISLDPVLASGEAGFETDTGKLKIGNGVDEWTALSYIAGEGGGGSGSFSYGLITDETSTTQDLGGLT